MHKLNDIEEKLLLRSDFILSRDITQQELTVIKEAWMS